MIISKSGKWNVIGLAELSQQNGKTEIENAKMIAEILMLKSCAYDMTIKVSHQVKQGCNLNK